MQIGSAIPTNVSPYACTPAPGTGAPTARDATSSGPVAVPRGEQRREGILVAAAGSGKADPSHRPPEEQAEIAELRRRDQEVRQHEAAHMAAGGAHVRGGASYSCQPGPDGKRYAVGGEVSIDVSPVGDNPAATIAKMQRVRGAALAPANPSGQDLAVAARASQAERQARMQAVAQVQQSAREGAAAPSAAGHDPTPHPAPSSPADTVGAASVATGSRFDAYA
ncbi:MAG: putative metalloprotease CJM1_0395 family protein [Deferrisomatales bacterium]|nr:putative metalloprotease CJM1_0395 family protein [Deferrisomatales bacterium]